MFYRKSIFLIFMLFFISCSSSPKPLDGSSEAFDENAIVINYSATNELNMYDNQPHVIPLVVYQLNNINSFNSLKKDKAGIIKLLEAESYDTSVMSVSKFFIAPNETKKLFLNRATRTTWVCLVSGYYDMQPSKSTLAYQIPDYNSWKFYKSEEKQKFLNIDLFFDKSSIEKR